MQNKIRIPLLILCLISISHVVASAQNCNPPAITANSQIYNIFSPEQEMIFGELNYQQLAGEMRFVQDEKLLAYVREIGDRLTRHLPPTGLKFQFFIIDIPSANAFNTPGGYVFLSRKLIAFTKTEDELAGVMAHELGHATVRHGAADMSQLFKKILNVTTLGDRKDITEKYNLLIERERTKRVRQSEGHENAQQLEADRIGLFAMVAAGYDPNSFSEFFSRLVEEKATSGNWFTNIFGRSNPEKQRLREMIKATEQLPAACRENRAVNASQRYLSWQADVVSFRLGQVTEELPGLLWKKELKPQLKSDISHFSVSHDGTNFLAQDDFAVTVVQRNPLKILFQIPTTDARPATFTPDGKFVVFGTDGLRFEKWSIADAKPVEIRELVVRRDCWEHEFSPDGKYLACVDYGLGLNILETQTGKKVWEKKDFGYMSFWEYFAWIAAESRQDSSSRLNTFYHLRFSPDSRYLIATRSNKFRFRFRIDVMTVDETDDALVALDLTTLKPVTTGGDLKKATRRPFIFLSADKILGTMPSVDDAGIFSFPQGKRLAKFPLACDEMKLTGNSNYVIIKPLAEAALGVFDVSKGQIVSGMNKADITFWNDLLIFELASGNVSVSETKFDPAEKIFRTTSLGTIDIPVGSMNRLHAANVSDNLQWLVVSSKTRGAIWDLSSGERKMFLRGVRGAIIAPNGAAIADFPKYDTVKHSLVWLEPNSRQSVQLREIPDKGARQYGRFVILRRPLRAPKEEKEPKEKEGEKAKVVIVNQSDETSLNREVQFELRDAINDKLVWTKEFKKGAPQFFFDDYSGRLIFYWTLGSEEGKARLKEDPALVERARQMGNKNDDYLVEVFDAFAGKSVGALLLETGNGSFDIESGFSEGNWLVLHDDNNRVLIYSINDGELRHRFFGANAAMNPSRNQVIVENYPGELTLYDLSTGDTQARLRFKTSAAFVRFSLDGKKLLVLTSGQVAHAFDTDQIIKK